MAALPPSVLAVLESDRNGGSFTPIRSATLGEWELPMDSAVSGSRLLTLEATANPDFGLVEADPAEVNLSAFETFFSERRPFFLEGNRLLQGSLNNYYYSRRIGAPPAGRASGDFVDYPSTSTILGAAKLTGRLESALPSAFSAR